MPTASEEIAARRARYAEQKYATDTSGRTIGVCRLRPSEQTMIQELTPGLDGSTTLIEDDPESENYGKSYEVAKRTPAIIAASVRSIDGQPIPFPKNRGELFAMMDRLDQEGLNAAGEAFSLFFPKKEEKKKEDEENDTDSPENKAKN